MTTMTVKPALLPTAEALDAAIKAANLKNHEVGAALNVSGNMISNYRTGKSAISPQVAAKLGELLHVDPALLTAPPGFDLRGKPLGGSNGAKPKKPKPGPARRAALRLERLQALPRSAPKPRAVQTPSRAPREGGLSSPSDGGVFGVQVNTDGGMLVWLRVTLPFAQGAALLRLLLEFGHITEEKTPGPPRWRGGRAIPFRPAAHPCAPGLVTSRPRRLVPTVTETRHN